MLVVALIAFVALQLWTAALIILRGLLFHKKIYRPMLWNLFLSLVPLLIQVVFSVFFVLIVPELQVETWSTTSFMIFVRALETLIVLWLVIWAVFFPNATYLITELNFSHRQKDDTVPLYYDIVMVFSLSLTGFINALASLSGFQLLLLYIFDSNRPTAGQWLIVMVYILASAFALYLGREVRVNSWDIAHPIRFIKKLGGRLKVREEWHKAVGYTLTFAGLLTVTHVMMFSLLSMALLYQ